MPAPLDLTQRLADRVAVITGGGGIGLATAQRVQGTPEELAAIEADLEAV